VQSLLNILSAQANTLTTAAIPAMRAAPAAPIILSPARDAVANRGSSPRNANPRLTTAIGLPMVRKASPSAHTSLLPPKPMLQGDKADSRIKQSQHHLAPLLLML
jgi:hypothetical protein